MKENARDGQRFWRDPTDSFLLLNEWIFCEEYRFIAEANEFGSHEAFPFALGSNHPSEQNEPMIVIINS